MRPFNRVFVHRKPVYQHVNRICVEICFQMWSQSNVNSFARYPGRTEQIVAQWKIKGCDRTRVELVRLNWSFERTNGQAWSTKTAVASCVELFWLKFKFKSDTKRKCPYHFFKRLCKYPTLFMKLNQKKKKRLTKKRKKSMAIDWFFFSVNRCIFIW